MLRDVTQLSSGGFWNKDVNLYYKIDYRITLVRCNNINNNNKLILLLRWSFALNKLIMFISWSIGTTYSPNYDSYYLPPSLYNTIPCNHQSPFVLPHLSYMSVYLILSYSKVPARKSSFGAPSKDFASNTVSNKLLNFYPLCVYAYWRKVSIWSVDEISICPRRRYKCSTTKYLLLM